MDDLSSLASVNIDSFYGLLVEIIEDFQLS